jgi:hypothetical protein
MLKFVLFWSLNFWQWQFWIGNLFRNPNDYHPSICLMRHNFPNLTFTFVDKYDTMYGCYKIIFDYKNRHQFCVYGILNKLIRCQIKDSKLLIGETVQMDRYIHELTCMRLDNNRLQCFEERNTKFVEYNLEAVGPNVAFRNLFDVKTSLKFDEMDVGFLRDVLHCVFTDLRTFLLIAHDKMLVFCAKFQNCGQKNNFYAKN